MVLSLAPFLKEREIQIRIFFLIVWGYILLKMGRVKTQPEARFEGVLGDLLTYTQPLPFLEDPSGLKVNSNQSHCLRTRGGP